CSSASPATDESRPEKRMTDSSSAPSFFTVMPAVSSGSSVSRRQSAASAYVFSALRSDATSSCSLNQGWFSSSCTKRCPTDPVAPRTATGMRSDRTEETGDSAESVAVIVELTCKKRFYMSPSPLPRPPRPAKRGEGPGVRRRKIIRSSYNRRSVLLDRASRHHGLCPAGRSLVEDRRRRISRIRGPQRRRQDDGAAPRQRPRCANPRRGAHR